jgi:hypothetical protein
MTPRRLAILYAAYLAAIWLVFGIAVAARGETVLLVVTQDGCGPCVQQKPLAQAAARATGVRFVEHNITRQGNPWGARTTPTTLLIEADADGTADVLAGPLVGVQSQAALEALVRGKR